MFLWLFSLLILRLSRGDNCFYLFILNSWSINTPGTVTHQPLAVPHKETELFGATKIWFWGGAVWFHSLSSLLFSQDSFKDASERLCTMQWGHGFVQNLGQREKKAKAKENFPIVNWQKNVSKGYTPPTHSFQMIKDLQEVMEGEKKGGWWSLEELFFFFKYSVLQVLLNKGQIRTLVTLLEDF